MTETTLGGRITEARNSRYLSTSQLAHRLGVQELSIENWESDQAEPSARMSVRLAGVLNVSVAWLLTGDQPPLADEDEASQLSETDNMSVKLDRLMALHNKTAQLTSEIQSELIRLQSDIDTTSQQA